MVGTRLLKGIRETSVRERVRKFFNPVSFDAKSCRDTLKMGINGFTLTEVLAYVLLQHSADLGEISHRIPDALLIGIALLEGLLAPLICWLGARRRRSVMVGCTLLGLIINLPLFALPKSEITQDAGLCTAIAPPSVTTGIPIKVAVRLTLLIINGLASALARSAMVGHGLAYINEHTPSVNLHMHVGIIIMFRVGVYGLGRSLTPIYIKSAWFQLLLNVIQFLLLLIRLYSYPEVAPRVAEHRQNDGGLFRCMSRVLSNGVVALLILVMGLLTAAWWGFAMHEPVFLQVKYNLVPKFDSLFTAFLHIVPVIFTVLLTGYMYTAPVMPKYDRKAATYNVARMCIGASLMYLLLTAALNCQHGGVAGAGETYIQPACGQSCGCDRPWMEYTPVCEPEQMNTYFSPCHAGCASSEVVNNVNVYSNCTCTPGGRVTVGPCTGGACDGYSISHQFLVLVLSVCNTLALVWMVTVVLETVDQRDVAAALGIILSVVALFTFVAAHAYYMWISSSTCAFNRGSKCLLQNNRFVPWVGYSSAGLAGLAFIFSVIAFLILRRQMEQEKNKEESDVQGDLILRRQMEQETKKEDPDVQGDVVHHDL